MKATIRGVLNDRYADKMKAPAPVQGAGDVQSDTLFEALFASDGGGADLQGDRNDEVDRYVTMGIVVSQSFIDIVQWWMA
jgi:hypothetical protein